MFCIVLLHVYPYQEMTGYSLNNNLSYPRFNRPRNAFQNPVFMQGYAISKLQIQEGIFRAETLGECFLFKIRKCAVVVTIFKTFQNVSFFGNKLGSRLLLLLRVYFSPLVIPCHVSSLDDKQVHGIFTLVQNTTELNFQNRPVGKKFNYWFHCALN